MTESLVDAPVLRERVRHKYREAWDTFGGARGEPNARVYAVYGYPFLARSA